jgi:predicted PhzF superfamily epimerase YddE/YHI9
MGRPSDIEIAVEGQPYQLTGVRIGGGVVKVAEGTLFV